MSIFTTLVVIYILNNQTMLTIVNKSLPEKDCYNIKEAFTKEFKVSQPRIPNFEILCLKNNGD